MNSKTTSAFVLKNGFYSLFFCHIYFQRSAAFLTFNNFNGLFQPRRHYWSLARMSLIVFLEN